MILATSLLLLAFLLGILPATFGETCGLENICFVLDESGSISKGEFNKEKAAVIAVARAIASNKPDVRYSAVAFSGTSRKLQWPTKLLESRFVPTVQNARPRGGATHMGSGINNCYMSMRKRSGERVIVLMTDGFDDSSRSVQRANSIKAAGVKIFAVGIGSSVSNAYLRRIASNPSMYIRTDFSMIVKDVMRIAHQLCGGGGAQPPPGGHGDPHIRGFDGSRFDFHGRHNAHFTLFARRGGDHVVATTVHVSEGGTQQQLPHPQRLTYFREFGVQTARSADRVRVAMARCPETGTWEVGVEVNDKALVGNWGGERLSVSQTSHTKVSVVTREATYVFKLMWPTSANMAHLNIEVELTRPLDAADEFSGVLGLTLNRERGRPVDRDIDTTVAAELREASLVRRFQIDSLFPSLRV